MKIAIMTWFSYMNYGTFLQATALSEKLKSYGHEVKIIQYYPREKEPLLPDKNIFAEFAEKAARKIRNRGIRNIVAERSGNLFNAYSEKYFDLTEKCETLSDLEKLSEEFDAFICGSDQIWSPLVFDSHYYLDFVKDSHKKIAYAPSMGVTEIKTEEIRTEINKLLENFEKISVREESGSRIISEIKKREIPVVLDPTLLLTKKDWAELFNLRKKKEKYLLAYFLGNNERHIKKSQEIAKRLNLEFRIIPVFEKDLSRLGVVSGVGPEEFTDLFYNAEYVCTDSFHGVAFSVNFGKDFTCFERFKKGDKENQNTRIYNILEKLDLKSRLSQSCEKRPVDKKTTELKLNFLREKSEAFLISSLAETENTSEKQKVKKHILQTNSLCCGCGACKEICPVNAIEIVMNEDGFYSAAVDENGCISCGKCKSVCPMENEDNFKNIKEGRLYSYKDNDFFTLQLSSSGGFAHRLSTYFSEKGYSVAGCLFDTEEKRAKHVLSSSEDAETLKKFSGSKYMQSDFASVTNDLVTSEKPLVIFGTPCQIAGARNLLKDKKDVVYVDLICHGVPSYNLFRKYEVLLREKYKLNTKNLGISFRHKPMGRKERYMCVSSDGKELIQHKIENEYFLMYESKNCYTKACYECRWRLNSSADMRIGDYWGDRFLLDETGVSMVLSMNETGENILKEVSSFGEISEQSISDYFNFQQTENVSPTVYYRKVMSELKDEKISLEDTVRKYITPFEKRKQVKNKIYEIIKKVIR